MEHVAIVSAGSARTRRPARPARRAPGPLPGVLLRSLLGVMIGGVLVAPANAQPASAGTDAPICRPAYFIAPLALQSVLGTYHLANGGLLQVRKEGNLVMADVRGVGRFRIVALDETHFAEKGGPVRMAFNEHDFATDVVITGLDQPRPDGRACSGG